ncbi:hypothetical protein M3Y98_01023500 [Aphelenchoides besseyi]|nr:hypothetical protein M3Y98_01023500 [Aphelenchoides besseyi]KAI6210046.1 hypothetical protein M3Y96_00285800 [Aphelenchoides besseyi]
MGIIKKLLSPVIGDTLTAINRAKTLIKADKISRGEKILAPKHPTEEKRFQEAQKDKEIKEKVHRIDENLIANVNQIKIRSYDPPEPTKSNRILPTRESESEHRNDPKYEYGFYEPPLEKMEKGKLMFREVMELLQAKMEIELNGENTVNAQRTLESHPATKRISKEDAELLFEFYRPFVIRDKQQVVSNEDLKILSEYMNNRGDTDLDLQDMSAEVKALFHGNSNVALPTGSPIEHMDDQEKKQFVEEYERRRVVEAKRLEKLLNNTNAEQIESEKEEKFKSANGG